MAATTMNAWTHHKAGLPSDVLSLSTVPVPSISSPSQVLIRTSHCAMNPGASIIMQLLPFVFRAPHAVPELDFAGTITEVGADVSPERELQVGAEVFGSIPPSQHLKSVSGALAKYVVVDHRCVVKKPVGMKMEEAAGLGVAGCTAVELMKGANLKRGDSVLVNGASGGVGHLVLQMCCAAVAETGRVVAVCSSGNAEWVGRLGAGVEVIAYDKNAPIHSFLVENFAAARFDAVIDAVGIQEIFEACPQFLAKGKLYVTVGPRQPSYTVLGILSTLGLMVKNILWPQLLGGVPRPYVQVAAVASLPAMQELVRMVEAGRLSVRVGAAVNMAGALEAYDRLLSGHTQGKIVVEMAR